MLNIDKIGYLDNNVGMSEPREGSIIPSPEVNSALNLRFSGASEKGIKAIVNRDLVYFNSDEGLAIVLSSYGPNPGGINQMLLDLLVKGNKQVEGRSMREAEGQMEQMIDGASEKFVKETQGVGGCSVTGVKFFEFDGQRAGIIFSAGRTRFYKFQVQDGRFLDLLTSDGVISRGKDREMTRDWFKILDQVTTQEEINGLAPELKRLWDENMENPLIEFSRQNSIQVLNTPIFEGTKIVLTTPGVHRNLTGDEMFQAIEETPEPAKALVDLAQQRSQDPTNVRANQRYNHSAVVVEDIS